MEESAVTIHPSETFDLDTIRSRIRDIKNTCFNDATELSASESEQLLKDSALHLERKTDRILSEFWEDGSLEVDDFDAYFEHLKGELNSVVEENAKVSNEIEDLEKTYIEDSSRLESELEGLNCSLDYISSEGLEEAKVNDGVDCFTLGDGQLNVLNANGDCNFKMLELSHQIEMNEATLKSLQDLDGIFRRFEAIEKIEDALTGLKVIEFEGNCIRLSLKTYIPNLESLACQQKIEDFNEPLEQNHELLIEVVDGTMVLKNVEIFPNDVYIGEIVDAAKSFRQLCSHLSMLEYKSPLEWFVRKVEDRIILSTQRRFVVKCANKSRHSFEYLDMDEIIVAHMVGGVDAFIKVPPGWPILDSALKLKTLKSSSHYSKEISLSFLCKVEELANSLDVHIRQSIASFVDAVEEILVQQMQTELQHDKNAEK